MTLTWNIPKPGQRTMVPLTALTELGNSLRDGTAGQIEYQISRDNGENGKVIHNFYISVPLLGDFRMLAIRTIAPITVFPVTILDFVNTTPTALETVLNKSRLIAENPEQLVEILQAIVGSANASQVVASLLAEIEGQSKLTVDRAGRMSPK